MGKIKSNKDLTITFNGDCIVHNIGIEASQKVALRSDKGDVLIGHHAFQATYGNTRLIKSKGSIDLKFDGGGVMELLTIKARDNVSVSWNNNLVLRKVIIEANSVNMKAFSSADTLSMEYSKLLTNYSVNTNVPVDEDKKEVKGSEISAEIQSLNVKGVNIMAQKTNEYYLSNLEYNQQQVQYWYKRWNTAYSSKGSPNSTRTVQEYGPWLPATWWVTGAEILATKGLYWWYGIHWKSGRSGQHMKNDEVTREDIRQTLAVKFGYRPECIMIDPDINARGITPTHHTGIGDAIMFDKYEIGYHYRSLDVRTEEYFDQTKYDAEVKYCQGQIDYYKESVNKGIYAKQQKEEAARLEAVRKQQQEALLAKQKAEAEAARKEEEKKQQIIDMVSSKDDKGRSELLIKFFDQADSDFIISQIKSKGFDVNYLAYLSIQNSHDALFALSLEEGAELESYQFEGKTLIQHIIHAANEEFLQKALGLCSDLSVTAIGAIEQGDLLTIEKLHAHNANFLQNKYKGQTLLQIAISNNSAIEIIENLIELDNSCCSILADNGESALKLAVINGNDEIIKLIESQTSIEEEIEQLGSDVDAQLKAEISRNQDMETIIRIFKGENISLEQYLLEQVKEDGEEEEDIALDELCLDVNHGGALGYTQEAQLAGQVDKTVIHLSGHVQNEHFSDFGYE